MPVVDSGDEEPPTLDLNAVVSYNVRAIRLLRGLTQDQVADRLAEFTGHRLPQASISQMERSFVDRRRRRLFDAHDLYLLAKVFDVPIVYFFLPAPTCLERRILTTGEPVTAIVDVLFGTSASLRAVDSRLAEIAPRPTEDDDATKPHHSASLSSVIDCNARLREIAHLLQELLDNHRA
ncbi:MAG: helix-turn-helix domain-containing protein [Acidimicrobiia bacterium]